MKINLKIPFKLVLFIGLLLVIGSLIWYFYDDISIFISNSSVEDAITVDQTLDADESDSLTPKLTVNSTGDEVIQDSSKNIPGQQGIWDQNHQPQQGKQYDSGFEDVTSANLLSILDIQNLRDPFEDIFKKAENTAKPKPIDSTDGAASIGNTSGAASLESEVIPYREDEEIEQDVTYEDLLQELGVQDDSMQETPQIVEPEIILPPFVLKGIVSRQDTSKAILLYNSQPLIVDSGQNIEDWKVEEITQNQVILSNERDQRFTLTLEGVMLDDTEN